ncbi:MAG: DoxX family protein [Gammaproteobacteria bacterium]|nr:DoxX family protein [Gammaproteobacteria bacterium]MDH4310117.1 DoxX family protein [Gammaproteobacteria bacterium]MDH5271569.1 DoxX family protein [Gammaproteobacteria bacterium]
MQAILALCERIPHSLIALLGRFSIAAVFWKSGQTKIEGFALDLFGGEFQLGWPRLAESTVPLFQEEYALPLVPPAIAAYAAATAEHVFPVLLLLGLGARFSALALLVMTLTIQVFVYPSAYPTHGVWATVLLYLLARGPGQYSVDHWLRLRSSSAGARA